MAGGTACSAGHVPGSRSYLLGQQLWLSCSASGMEAGKIEEMEKMLKEAHAEKSRLMESRVSGDTSTAASWGLSPPSPGLNTCVCWQEREMELRQQALEDERRRREKLERRLQDETARRQKLVEKEVKLREKHFSQVRGRMPPSSTGSPFQPCQQGRPNPLLMFRVPVRRCGSRR